MKLIAQFDVKKEIWTSAEFKHAWCIFPNPNIAEDILQLIKDYGAHKRKTAQPKGLYFLFMAVINKLFREILSTIYYPR